MMLQNQPPREKHRLIDAGNHHDNTEQCHPHAALPGHALVGKGSALPRLVQELWLLPRNIAILLMHAYRRVISPLYGQVCRYHPSCSRYALEVFQLQGFVPGLALTAWRLLRCNPFSAGGIDDPPAREQQIFSINSRGFARPTIRKA